MNAPFRLTSTIRCQCSSVSSRNARASAAAPVSAALFTITSNRPNVPTAAAMAAYTSIRRLTSQPRPIARWPVARSAAASRSAISSRRCARTTVAPSSAQQRAIPSPIPVPPPVMSTTLLSRRWVISSYLTLQRELARHAHHRGTEDTEARVPFSLLRALCVSVVKRTRVGILTAGLRSQRTGCRLGDLQNIVDLDRLYHAALDHALQRAGILEAHA